MSATLYERIEDARREDAIAARLAKAWGLEQTKAPPLARFDRELWMDGSLKALVEIKARTNERDRWPFYMIDAGKIADMIHTTDALRVGGFLVVQFSDGLFYVPVQRRLLEWTKQGGRLDRNDEHDIETCCFFPVTYFRRVEE